MIELWQLYDEQGRSLKAQGASKDDVFSKGLLHGASHVWIWRQTNMQVEILLQKRASNKRTWPNRYDISAAGHIDLHESPFGAALRETREEIGLEVSETLLKLIAVNRANEKAENGSIENEFQWLYLLKLSDNAEFSLQESEVAALKWKSLETFKTETRQNTDQFVPHGNVYFDIVISKIEADLFTRE